MSQTTGRPRRTAATNRRSSRSGTIGAFPASCRLIWSFAPMHDALPTLYHATYRRVERFLPTVLVIIAASVLGVYLIINHVDGRDQDHAMIMFVVTFFWSRCSGASPTASASTHGRSSPRASGSRNGPKVPLTGRDGGRSCLSGDRLLRPHAHAADRQPRRGALSHDAGLRADPRRAHDAP